MEFIPYRVSAPNPDTPFVHHPGDAEIQVFPRDQHHGDRTTMYAIDVYGVSVCIRRRGHDTFVHIEDESIPDDAQPLTVSIQNGPDFICE